ncbi:helix-turn-helix domain-containing protein [Paenibacillus sp. CECT 9249]|uniref:AraC family transcriptional regulator n=1 Tax=unclassified Paenibacillus TaxID=185978 RepID=UPI001C105736|nr:helix-turn-helix domain-containing protein [Paenibacillus sp. CECT 9249]MBU5443668.1 AraC family transcriptional regulator [Paenibacillus sp. MSJ-34]CAH0117671.1 HTH-type transcriptional activator RhaS [Paenibacillus sp. CECT 9249]
MLRQHPTIAKDHIMLPSYLPIQISQNHGVSPLFQRLHRHHELEINYIVEGTGYYLINGIKYSFRKGDILLINSNDLHRAFETENLEIEVIMFDPSWLATEQRYDPELLLPFHEMGIRFTHLLDRTHPKQIELAEILQDMRTEFLNQAPSFVSVIRSHLIRFLALVNRYFALKEANKTRFKLQGSDLIQDVVQIMEQQIAIPWTVRRLANLVHLSPSRFCALFSQIVGTSPIDYLIQLRLAHAVHLLKTTDRKIIEISMLCGFRNLSNFNRLFRLHIGQSPTDIRQAVQHHE